MLKRLLLSILIYPCLSFGISDSIKYQIFHKQSYYSNSPQFMNASLLKRELYKIPRHKRKKAINESLKLLCNVIGKIEWSACGKAVNCLKLLHNLGAQIKQSVLNHALFKLCKNFNELDSIDYLEHAYKAIDLLLTLGANPKDCIWESYDPDLKAPFPVICHVLKARQKSYFQKKAVNQIIRIIRRLCQADCDPNIGVGFCHWFGNVSPLFLAHTEPDIVACLLEVGANPNDFVIEPEIDTKKFEKTYGPVSQYNHTYSSILTRINKTLNERPTCHTAEDREALGGLKKYYSAENLARLKKVKKLLIDHGARPLPDYLITGITHV